MQQALVVSHLGLVLPSLSEMGNVHEPRVEASHGFRAELLVQVLDRRLRRLQRCRRPVLQCRRLRRQRSLLAPAA